MQPRRVSPAGQHGEPGGAAMRCSEQLDEQGFADLERRYQRSGGLATCEQVSVLIREHDSQPVSTLAHWIVAGEVVHFAWHAHLMLPLFQFLRPSITPLPGVGSAVSEWQGALDPLGLALWFGSAHAMLGGEAPADAMRLHPQDVVQAARADRHALRSA